MSEPVLTVLMSVKNGEAYLREAVGSILNQTYKEFEFLILDNASTDRSRDIIRSFNDPRIRLIMLPGDIGQVAALNKGLDMIDTQLVARMDADDISLPQRFERQVEFMNNHPEIGICGTFAVAFEGNSQERWAKPCLPEDIRAGLLLGCCMVHPSVVMRKSLLDKYQLRYNEQIGYSEDWELWQRAVRHFDLANIPEYLVKYRIHSASVSVTRFDARKEAERLLLLKSLELLGLADHPLHGIHKEIVLATNFNAQGRNVQFITQVLDWFEVLTVANQRTRLYDQKALQKTIKERLFFIIKLNPQLKGWAVKFFFKERLFREAGVVASIKFLGKVSAASLGLIRFIRK